MKDYFVEQADYQRWACEELFKSLDSLSDAQRREDQGLFFSSIHRTVDHILIVTRNWSARLMGEFDNITGYDNMLCEDWEELKPALANAFIELGEWLRSKSGAWFDGEIEYPGSGGKVRKAGVRDSLTHIMTHAVHHRGQVSAVCTRLGATSPEMDFVFYRWRAGK